MHSFPAAGYDGSLPNPNDAVVMAGLQIFMSRDLFTRLYAIVIALAMFVLPQFLKKSNKIDIPPGQMLSATSFQITLLSGQIWQDDLQLYVLVGVCSLVYPVPLETFSLRPRRSFFLQFGVPHDWYPIVARNVVGAHQALLNAATWSSAVSSLASFLFFGLNFGEKAVRVVCVCFSQPHNR